MTAWCDCMQKMVEPTICGGCQMRGEYKPDIARHHWAVTVSRDGEEIVTIESNCLSGREISAEDEETIRTAARALLGFIGDPLTP